MCIWYPSRREGQRLKAFRICSHWPSLSHLYYIYTHHNYTHRLICGLMSVWWYTFCFLHFCFLTFANYKNYCVDWCVLSVARELKFIACNDENLSSSFAGYIERPMTPYTFRDGIRARNCNKTPNCESVTDRKQISTTTCVRTYFAFFHRQILKWNILAIATAKSFYYKFLFFITFNLINLLKMFCSTNICMVGPILK